MSLYRKNIGKIGEQLALDYLLQKGYTLLEQNFTSHWGEIDIIMKKASTILFIEVKTRMSESHGKPYEAVNVLKLSHLKRPIQYYLLKNNCKNYKLSLDVIGIVLKADLTVRELKHYENIDINI